MQGTKDPVAALMATQAARGPRSETGAVPRPVRAIALGRAVTVPFPRVTIVIARMRARRRQTLELRCTGTMLAMSAMTCEELPNNQGWHCGKSFVNGLDG